PAGSHCASAVALDDDNDDDNDDSVCFQSCFGDGRGDDFSILLDEFIDQHGHGKEITANDDMMPALQLNSAIEPERQLRQGLPNRQDGDALANDNGDMAITQDDSLWSAWL